MSEAGSPYSIGLDPGLSPPPVLPGLVWAEGVRVLPSASPPPFLADILARVREAGEGFVPQAVRDEVRAMLRFGRYKPSGRGKPASEFLLRAALGGEFPLVNGPVDVNNAVSLESGLPGSIFDADLSGRDLQLRRGEPGESYVFNPSGQAIDLEDLLVVCRRVGDVWQPCGNPVKDSMATKIHAGTTNVVAVLYAPASESASALGRWCERYAELLSSHCGAKRAGFRVPDGA
ncbi:MAG: phenylalanine--tRNA ligase beta subunit-related protein [Candidatus Bipolaricaulota bacterium]|nr:phenylalanine--tRNA ligase beta subunit-related protein [Candidatus Bipolaricaulota bacterium]